MHLDHKIPWNTASKHLHFVRLNPKFTPRRTDIFPQSSSTSAIEDLRHFCRVFVSTVEEFATTTEASLSSSAIKTTYSDDIKLFSDHLRQEVQTLYRLGDHQTCSLLHNPLGTQHQDLRHWIDKVETVDGTRFYSTSNGELADVVKTLIVFAAEHSDKSLKQEALYTVSFLATHPQVPLESLRWLSWGHAFGVECVLRPALEIYLLLNLAEIIQFRSQNGVDLFELHSFHRFICNSTVDYDYPSQNLPHRKFWKALGLDPVSITSDVSDDHCSRRLVYCGGNKTGAELRNYLKTCFEIVYRYFILLRWWSNDHEARLQIENELVEVFRTWGINLKDL